MTKGSRKRKGRPVGTPPDRKVWLVATERDSAHQEVLRAAVTTTAEAQGWEVAVRRAEKLRVRGGEDKDRPYRSLAPRDARELYEDLHRRPCLVITTHACHVRADPSREPAVLRELVPLAEFVAYKAGFALVRGEAEAAAAVAGFAAWPPAEACAGRHDPRIVPLHVFDSTTSWPDLNAAVGRNRFDRHYSLRAGTRTDERGHRWAQPNGLHGRDTALVAGVELEQGFHWDVQKSEGSGTVSSESEKWKLNHGRAYLNVYPNGHIRGDRQHGARQVWPRRQSTSSG